MKFGKITKLTDDKFKGYHPNNIFEGYTKSGKIYNEPKIGYSFVLGSFCTSEVTKILEQNEFCVKFKTLNSTYLLEYEKSKDN